MKELSVCSGRSLAALLLAVMLPCAVSGADLKPVLKSQWPGFPRGYANAVRVVGDRAYVTLGGAGFEILDISEPVSPKRLGGHEVGGYAYDISVSGDHVFVAASGAVGFKSSTSRTRRIRGARAVTRPVSLRAVWRLRATTSMWRAINRTSTSLM